MEYAVVNLSGYVTRYGAFILLSFATIPFLLYVVSTMGRGAFVDAHTEKLMGLEITLERRRAHPFLSEYYRTLIIKNDAGLVVRHDINMDSGKDYRVEICKSSEGNLFASDGIDIYNIISRAESIEVVPKHLNIDRCPALIGKFETDKSDIMRFINN